MEIIRAAVTDDIYRLLEGTQYDKYWECFKLRKDEVLVNCGSASGDTILKFLLKNQGFEKIYAFEGNLSEYSQLVTIINELPNQYIERIETVNEYIGLEASTESFNHKFNQKKLTLINMDIEGAEMGVLKGASEIIVSQRPVMAVCAYHKAADLIEIPFFIDSVVNDYYIYLRKYKGYEPNALNEWLYYLVPKERAI